MLPVTQAVAGSAIPLLATNVSADTAVTLTVQDSAGKTATAAITVRAATAVQRADRSSRTCPIAAPPPSVPGRPARRRSPLQLPGGGAAPGRQVRFDVVAGPYAIAATGSGASAQSVTVVSDAAGNAQVIIRANVDAPTQPAQIRATDITSGQQLTGDFLIQQRTDGSTILTVVPPEATITGAFVDECSSGFRVDYFIYGGTPPYRITQAFPTRQSHRLLRRGRTSAIVNASGGFFEVVTNGTCVNPQTFSILDATGRQTTAQLFNLPGTASAAASTPPPPDLSVVPGVVCTSTAARPTLSIS